MEYRIRKQIIILIIVFLILALIGTGAYFLFLKPKPTCTDNIKNQDETEIDCGGKVCQPCEINTLKNIETVWVKVFPLSNGNYDFAAKIINPNPNFGNKSFRYSFEVLDAAGQLLGRLDGISFILPNESKYLIGNNFLSKQPVASVNLKIDSGTKNDWQMLADYQGEQLLVKDKNFAVLNNIKFSAQANGVVKNNTKFDFDTVVVSLVLFDASHQPIGAAISTMNTLRAGEERYFSVKWSMPFASPVASYEMQAETNLLSDENYLRVYGVPENQ